jgi:hypothetical protein
MLVHPTQTLYYTNTTRLKSTDRPQHDDSGRPQNPIITNRLVIQTKKIKKETSELNDTIDQIDLTDIYRVFYPAAAQYTFLSAAHGTFFKINYI